MTASLLTLLHKIVGSVLVLFGMVLFPMPIPVGLVMIAFGLLMLAPHFHPVQRVVRSLRRRSVAVDRALLKVKQRCPAVIRSAIEKTAP